MAKKAPRGERSQQIRDYLAANPNAGPGEVVKGLAEKGITVKAGLVSAIKYKKTETKVKGKLRRAGRKAGGHSVGNGLTVDVLILAKQLADAAGGTAAAKSALDTLEQLR